MSMFRDLDIRGKYGSEVTEQNFRRLGRASAAFFDSLLAGMDYRPHNPDLLHSFALGFQKPIQSLGHAPSPAIAFLSRKTGMSLTASHNPAEYHGAKFFQSRTYVSQELMQSLQKKYGEIEATSLEASAKNEEHRERVRVDDVSGDLKKYEESLPEIRKGIFDLGGGAVCRLKHVFPQRLFDEPDPFFKKRAPEPKDETLGELKKKTLEKEVGFAFDGDGDRVLLVDQGKTIEGDITAAFIATQLVGRRAPMVLSIDCREEVFQKLRDEGFHVFTSKVGDANVLRLALEKNAVFSAERSGHYAFLQHAPNSDGIYAAARLSETRAGELADFAKQFKNVTLKEEVFVQVDFKKMEAEIGKQEKAEEVVTLDGVKAVFENYTLLIRASTTEPKVRINSEAQTVEKAKEGLRYAKQLVEKARTGLDGR